ncbi:MAG TPA: TraR/DksA family transcriptional regulator [Sphingomicrobium sp.]|jgi:RNA polymerase-binding transcription factor DksA|nr:TraR/DksA family transcriptional regulator [Sphingomicrobium sp.]
MPDFAAARVRLEAALAELEARLSNIAEDLDQPADRDWDEQAIEVEDDESLERQGTLVTREIASVKRALARIDDGTYGECVRCGGAIAPARLDARPEAALCIDCARQAE